LFKQALNHHITEKIAKIGLNVTDKQEKIHSVQFYGLALPSIHPIPETGFSYP
jgi:hypothetical protein